MRELLRGLNTGLFKVFWRVKKLCGFFFLNTYTHTSTVFMINQKSWWCMGIYCWALVRYSRQHGTQRRLICYGWSHSWAAQLSLWCTWLAHLVANWKVGGSNSPRDNLVFFSGTCEQPCFRNLLLFCEALLQRSLNWSAKSHPRYLLKPQVPGPWDSDPVVLKRWLGICMFKPYSLPFPPPRKLFYHSCLHRICVEDKITGSRATLLGLASLLLHSRLWKVPWPPSKVPTSDCVAQHPPVVIKHMLVSDTLILSFKNCLLSASLNSPSSKAPHALCGAHMLCPFGYAGAGFLGIPFLYGAIRTFCMRFERWEWSSSYFSFRSPLVRGAEEQMQRCWEVPVCPHFSSPHIQVSFLTSSPADQCQP